jgi:L-ascorbate metabolism protein UlaG (beta-lactamase superfamily)
MDGSELIPASCRGIELQQQIRRVVRGATEGHLDIWWLGQSGFLVHWNGRCVLFDPYLSDSLTAKYANTEKPHIRMSELVIAPDLLDMVGIVTSSHNHTDHLDAETLIPLLETNPEARFIIPEANRDFVCNRIKCDKDFPLGLDAGGKIEVDGIIFHGVPAAHNTIEKDEKGQCKFMGLIVKMGSWILYHSGDTLWYEGMEKTLKPFHVDIAFLPINGNVPSRGVAGNLNGWEAAHLGRKIGARLVIPHHYDMFRFNTADPRDFAREAVALEQPYKILKPGEHYTFT